MQPSCHHSFHGYLSISLTHHPTGLAAQLERNHGQNRSQGKRYGRRTIAAMRFTDAAEERILRGDFVILLRILAVTLPSLVLVAIPLLPLLGARDAELCTQDFTGIRVAGVQLAKARRHHFPCISCGK